MRHARRAGILTVDAVGDGRGGHGLFAVLELVADRSTREPLAPWPTQPRALTALLAAAMDAGVSIGARGNLLIIAPPLVITEPELADALTVLDRLLTKFFTIQGTEPKP